MTSHDAETAPRLRALRRLAMLTAFAAVAGCGGGKSGGDDTAQPVSTPPPAASAPAPAPAPGASAPAAAPPASSASSPSGTSTAQSYTALTYPQQDPTTQYTLSDGTLVTQIGGRVRDRHAREQPDSPGTGDPYDLFAAHYFERRTHQVTIYDNVSATNPQ